MKSKVLLLALAAMLAGGAMAQDCTFFFPTTKGTKLVKKSYDGKGNLSGVMTYVVDEVESKQSGLEVEADYVFVNNGGTVIDKGRTGGFLPGWRILYGYERGAVQSIFCYYNEYRSGSYRCRNQLSERSARSIFG